MKKKRVLIVEDESSLLSILSTKISDEGYIVSTAINGEDGLVKSKEVLPDLILLDLVMPKMDGVSMMKKLRTEPWGKDIPIIVMTNLNADNNELINELMESKPLFYLVKSDWKIHDIVDKINEVLDN